MSLGNSSGTPQVLYLNETFTVPPFTAQTAPYTVKVGNLDIWCHSLKLRVPPGPGGLMGFTFTYGGSSIVPWAEGLSYLVWDNQSDEFIVETEIGSSMVFNGFNNDFWPHSVYMQMAYEPIAAYGVSQISFPTIVELD